MIQTDSRGLLVSCPHCQRHNRMPYEQLGRIFQCGQCHNPLPAIHQPVDVPDQTSFKALVGQSGLAVLVDFWAPWCGPCKMVAPEVVKIAAQFAGRLLVAKVNTEQAPVLGQQYGVSAIPLLMLFRAGREVARQAGALPAPAIGEFIRRANVL